MIFNITPRGPARMTRFSKFSPDALQYKKWKVDLCVQAAHGKYDITCPLSLRFHLPMPASWSKVKRDRMRGQPHQQKPDLDNCIKTFTDAICYGRGDAHIWSYGKMEKVWADEGAIEVL